MERLCGWGRKVFVWNGLCDLIGGLTYFAQDASELNEEFV